ncbi:phasin family protein [Methylosinus sp. RM1]|uniref:phasin family protein n=1 Tax=Methylosinus sp. RM1 TaxID=2583817 RepID=UPI00140D08C7|nr:phasin family protein [Methylosinus sp. RM1]
MATHTRGSSKRPAPPKEPPITLKDALDDDEPEAPPPASSAPAAEIEAVAAALEAVEIETVTAALEPVELGVTTAEPVIETSEPALEIVSEPIAEAPIALAVIATTIETPAPKPEAIALDPSLWPLKTIDLVNENAAAVFDLALALGQARTVGDALEAQSRFASERYSTFVKRANEFVELSSRWSPFRFAVSAFVA